MTGAAMNPGPDGGAALNEHLRSMNARNLRLAALLIGGIFLGSLPMDFILVPDKIMSFVILRLSLALASLLLYLGLRKTGTKYTGTFSVLLYILAGTGMAGFGYLFPEGAELVNRAIFGFIFLLGMFIVWHWRWTALMSGVIAVLSLLEQTLSGRPFAVIAVNTIYLIIAATVATLAAMVLLKSRSNEFLARLELQTQKSWLEKITSTSPNLIYIFDLRKRMMVYANRARDGFMGYTAEDMRALGPDMLSEIVHPEDLPRAMMNLERFRGMSDRAVSEFSQRVRSASGDWHWLAHREIIFRRDAEGRPEQILGVAQDISEIKKAEREASRMHLLADQARLRAEESARDLAVLNEQKNQLLGAAAHDLRNPLGAVRGFSEFLLQDNGLSPEQELFVRRIFKSSEYMLKLVDNLLDLSRINVGVLELNRMPTDLRELVHDTVELSRPIALRKNMRLLERYAEDLRPVALDPVKMQQVVDNLVSNAIKYSHPGTAVEVQIAGAADAVQLSVTDFGQGIPGDELDAIFQPFTRASPRTTGGEPSSGLGLAIVRKIVEGHGGTIEVHSKVNIGSQFTVSLPA